MRRVLAVILAIFTVAISLEAVLPGSVEAQSNPPIPRLRINPDCIADPGSNVVRVRGSGFARNGQVRLRFYLHQTTASGPGVIAASSFAGFGPPAAVTAQGGDVVGTANTDGLGTFDINVTLVAPVSTTLYSAAPTYGRLWVLEGRTVGGGPQTTVLVRSNCDTERVTVQTGCKAANAGQTPSQVTVRADGFGPSEKAEVSIRRLNGAEVFNEVIVTNGQGRINRNVNTGGYPAGDYQVAIEDSDHYAIGWFQLPCPTLEIRARPDCFSAGSPPDRFDVRIVATGFHPGREAWIIWDSSRAHEFWTAGTDKSGRLAITISPYRRGAGSYTIRVRTDDGESAVRQRTITFDVPCEPTTLVAAQTCGRPRIEGDPRREYQFKVSGAGYSPGPMTVVFDADGTTGAEEFETTANSAGRYSLTISPRMRPLGTYRIVARQQGAPSRVASVDGVLEAEGTFRVPCRDREPPPLTIDPVCGLMAPDEPRAYEIVVSGSDYYPNSTVIVSFGQSDAFEVTAKRDGTFETTIRPSGKDASRVPVRAQQRDTLGALAAGASARFEVPCPIDPSIEISPSYGQAGYTTTVSGVDFWPGTVVTLTWDKGITAGQPMLVEVGEDGSFEVHVFILPNDFPGERTLEVGMVDAPAAFPEVDGTFIVVPGSGLPGGGSDDIVGRR